MEYFKRPISNDFLADSSKPDNNSNNRNSNGCLWGSTLKGSKRLSISCLWSGVLSAWGSSCQLKRRDNVEIAGMLRCHGDRYSDNSSILESAIKGCSVVNILSNEWKRRFLDGKFLYVFDQEPTDGIKKVLTKL